MSKFTIMTARVKIIVLAIRSEYATPPGMSADVRHSYYACRIVSPIESDASGPERKTREEAERDADALRAANLPEPNGTLFNVGYLFRVGPPRLIVRNAVTGETIGLVRDVRHHHPDWVHAQCGTESESELQAMLDRISAADYVARGFDECGIGLA